MNRFDYIEDAVFIRVFNNADSKGNICKSLNIPYNGTSMNYINDMIKRLNLDVKVLKTNRHNKFHLKKVCPVCGKEFEVLNCEKDKVCCSCACSNTYFRSGKNNGMYSKATRYATLCFRHHPHKCCVCGEEKIVAVHHYDGNHNNNEIGNLIPLCPTHHCYVHSNYKDEVINFIDEYRKQFNIVG